MSKEKKVLKTDLNFLEYPMWVISRRGSVTTFVMKVDRGEYEILCAQGLPTHYDELVFLFLGQKLYKETALYYWNTSFSS